MIGYKGSRVDLTIRGQWERNIHQKKTITVSNLILQGKVQISINF